MRQGKRRRWHLGRLQVCGRTASKKPTHAPTFENGPTHLPPIFLPIDHILPGHMAGIAAHLAGGAMIFGQRQGRGQCTHCPECRSSGWCCYEPQGGVVTPQCPATHLAAGATVVGQLQDLSHSLDGRHHALEVGLAVGGLEGCTARIGVIQGGDEVEPVRGRAHVCTALR